MTPAAPKIFAILQDCAVYRIWSKTKGKPLRLLDPHLFNKRNTSNLKVEADLEGLDVLLSGTADFRHRKKGIQGEKAEFGEKT